ncbi:MAG: hypothetical protein ACI9ND_003436 [Yoonia sp.]
MPTTINGQVMTAQELAAWAVDTGAFVLFDDRLAPAGLMGRRGIALTDVKSAPATATLLILTSAAACRTQWQPYPLRVIGAGTSKAA